MSNYNCTVKIKRTGEVKDVYAQDNFFGHHQYGYSDGEKTYRENEVEIVENKTSKGKCKCLCHFISKIHPLLQSESIKLSRINTCEHCTPPSSQKEGFEEEIKEQLHDLRCVDYEDVDDKIEIIINQLKSFLSQTLKEEREKVINAIDPIDLVHHCKPDCTPVEHAYHQGTWDAHLKLEKMLTILKK